MKGNFFENLFSEDYDATTFSVVISSRNTFENLFSEDSSDNIFNGSVFETDSPL